MSKRSTTVALQVNDDWRIDTDGELNWIIMFREATNPNHHLSKKNGPGYRWKTLGYYGTLGSALLAVHNKMVIVGARDSDGTLATMLDVLATVTVTVEDAIKRANV